MCVNGRWITNRFTHQEVFVKCGCCPACLQEKAGVLQARIREHTSLFGVPYFITLTYDRISCPFVRLSEIISTSEHANVFRHYSVRRNKVTGKYVRSSGDVLLTDKYNFKRLDFDPSSLSSLKHCKGDIGVIYYEDVKNFFKRLRINLKRRYCYDGKIQYFACSEYGPTTARPHFHLLVWFDHSAVSSQSFKSCVCESWPYAHKSRTFKYIELARDCSSYVSSYVNCTTCVSPYLQDNFKPKRSASLWFGVDSKKFTPDFLLDCSEKADFEVDRVINCKGDVARFCVDERVISRYFPLFKGYSRLSDVEAFLVLRCFNSIERYAEKLGYIRDADHDNFRDTRNIINRSFSRTWSLHHGDRDLFASYFVKVRRAFKSFVLKHDMFNSEQLGIPLNEQFYNVRDYRINMHSGLDLCPPMTSDPNLFPHIIASTARQSEYFYKRVKKSKITNLVMSNNNHYV